MSAATPARRRHLTTVRPATSSGRGDSLGADRYWQGGPGPPDHARGALPVGDGQAVARHPGQHSGRGHADQEEQMDHRNGDDGDGNSHRSGRPPRTVNPGGRETDARRGGRGGHRGRPRGRGAGGGVRRRHPEHRRRGGPAGHRDGHGSRRSGRHAGRHHGRGRSRPDYSENNPVTEADDENAHSPGVRGGGGSGRRVCWNPGSDTAARGTAGSHSL